MDNCDDPKFRLLSGDTRSLAKNSRCLRSFYSIASPQDAQLMDLLLWCRETFMSVTRTRRDFVPFDVRIAYEKMCNAIEASYLCARNCVYETDTFRRLQPDERREIEAAVDGIS